MEAKKTNTKNVKNLKSFGKDKPPLSHEEAVKNGKKGGLAKAKSDINRRFMKQTYASVLSGKYNYNGKELETGEIIGDIIIEILKKKNSDSVRLLKELREGTESVLEFDPDEGKEKDIVFIKPDPAEIEKERKKLHDKYKSPMDS